MPTEEEALRSLVIEIQAATPPLRNVRFTNRYTTSYIGRVILDRVADIESLETMGEMDLEETTNLAGAFDFSSKFLTSSLNMLY